MPTSSGSHLREHLGREALLPFVGVYDVFSASLAAQYYQGLFLSGFGFSASFYELQDMGFISWSDMVVFVQRARAVLPHHHLLVDIDDDYGDTEIACHVVSLLESVGASEIIAAGVAMVNYSTPCLFAAQGVIHEALQALNNNDGLLPSQMEGEGTVQGCTEILRDNLARRDKK